MPRICLIFDSSSSLYLVQGKGNQSSGEGIGNLFEEYFLTVASVRSLLFYSAGGVLWQYFRSLISYQLGGARFSLLLKSWFSLRSYVARVHIALLQDCGNFEVCRQKALAVQFMCIRLTRQWKEKSNVVVSVGWLYLLEQQQRGIPFWQLAGFISSIKIARMQSDLKRAMFCQDEMAFFRKLKLLLVTFDLWLLFAKQQRIIIF